MLIKVEGITTEISDHDGQMMYISGLFEVDKLNRNIWKK